MNKKIQNIESNYDVAVEDLFNQSVKLEAMEKKNAGGASLERYSIILYNILYNIM